jgi:hypothetical protein
MHVFLQIANTRPSEMIFVTPRLASSRGGFPIAAANVAYYFQSERKILRFLVSMFMFMRRQVESSAEVRCLPAAGGSCEAVGSECNSMINRICAGFIG